MVIVEGERETTRKDAQKCRDKGLGLGPSPQLNQGGKGGGGRKEEGIDQAKRKRTIGGMMALLLILLWLEEGEEWI